MRQWKVYKDPEDRWLRWVAIPIHENWWERPQGRRFPEWGMAMLGLPANRGHVVELPSG